MCRSMFAGALVSAVIGSASLLSPAMAATPDEGKYEFAAPPGDNFLRVYRVDRATGEIGACEYGAKEGTPGSTVCYPAGDGAGPQGAGEYGLVRSNLAKEGSVFRVNRNTGDMSICYVLDAKIVCTPSAR